MKKKIQRPGIFTELNSAHYKLTQKKTKTNIEKAIKKRRAVIELMKRKITMLKENKNSTAEKEIKKLLSIQDYSKIQTKETQTMQKISETIRKSGYEEQKRRKLLDKYSAQIILHRSRLHIKALKKELK